MEKKNAQSNSQVNIINEFRACRPRPVLPCLKKIMDRIKGLFCSIKLKRTFLLYWGRILFNFNEIYLSFVLLQLNPKHALINTSLTCINYFRKLYSPISFLKNLLKTTQDIVTHIQIDFIYIPRLNFVNHCVLFSAIQ